MKVRELIDKLKEMPQDMNVCVFDWRKNLCRGGGDDCSDGVETIKDITVVPDDETTELMRANGKEVAQWVGIHYANDDYLDEGLPIIGGDYHEELRAREELSHE